MHRAGQTSTWQHINKAISLETNVILLYNKWYFYAGSESIPLSKSGQFVVIIFRIEGICGERGSYRVFFRGSAPKHTILQSKKHSFRQPTEATSSCSSPWCIPRVRRRRHPPTCRHSIWLRRLSHHLHSSRKQIARIQFQASLDLRFQFGKLIRCRRENASSDAILNFVIFYQACDF